MPRDRPTQARMYWCQGASGGAVTTPKIKVENTRALGAEVILFDGDTAARWERVYEIAAENHTPWCTRSRTLWSWRAREPLAAKSWKTWPTWHTVIVPSGGGLDLRHCHRHQGNRTLRACGASGTALTPKYFHSRINKERTSLPLNNTIADGCASVCRVRIPTPSSKGTSMKSCWWKTNTSLPGMRMLAQGRRARSREPAASIGIGALLAGGLESDTAGEGLCCC